MMNRKLLITLCLLPMAAFARLGESEAQIEQRYGDGTQVTGPGRGIWIPNMKAGHLMKSDRKAVDLRRYKLAGVAVYAAFFKNSYGSVVVGEIFYGFPRDMKDGSEEQSKLIETWFQINSDGHEWTEVNKYTGEHKRLGATAAYSLIVLKGFSFCSEEYATHVDKLLKKAAEQSASEVNDAIGGF